MGAPSALASSCQPSSTPAHAGKPAKKAKPLGKSQGVWLPTPAHASETAVKAKPLRSSQGARSGWRVTLLAPASWLLPDLLGLPKRPGTTPTRAGELALKAKPLESSQGARSGWRGNPTCAGKLAFARPFGISQKARGIWERQSKPKPRKNQTHLVYNASWELMVPVSIANTQEKRAT